MITDNVKKALERYKQVIVDMTLDAKFKSVSIEIVLQRRKMDKLQKELEQIKEPYQSKIDEFEKYIEIQALEIGTSFEHMGVKVSYVKGYERITWTRKAMDEICLQNPALLSVLAPARKITPVDPSVSIAILETEKEPKESP